MIRDYKNYNELKLREERRAHRVRDKDRALYERSIVPTNFGRSSNDQIEFALYDMSDNLLSWKVNLPNNAVFTAGSLQSKGSLPEVVVDPFDDIEKANYDRGSFRTSYQFLKKRVGSHVTADKVFIKDISPSRTEARILPVLVGNHIIDSQMKKRFQHFKHNDQEKYDVMDIVNAAVNEVSLQMIKDEFNSLFIEHFQYDFKVSDGALEYIFLNIKEDIKKDMSDILLKEDDDFISYQRLRNIFLVTLTAVVDRYIPRLHEV